MGMIPTENWIAEWERAGKLELPLSNLTAAM